MFSEYTMASEEPYSIYFGFTKEEVDCLFQTYWNNSGPYDEIYDFIKNNVDDVRDDLALMVSGVNVAVRIKEYAAVSMRLRTREEIFSAMVVYGFLTYQNGKVRIPNRELLGKFTDMVQKRRLLAKR